MAFGEHIERLFRFNRNNAGFGAHLSLSREGIIYAILPVQPTLYHLFQLDLSFIAREKQADLQADREYPKSSNLVDTVSGHARGHSM